MSERKNLKISKNVYDDLREAKGQYETWDGLFTRLISEEET